MFGCAATVSQLPAPMAVLPAGAEFRVRYSSAYDDTIRNRSAEEQASGWEPPLSTVRGRVGGWDDVDDAMASSRLMDLAWRVSSASHAAAAENIASSVGAAVGRISEGGSEDNNYTAGQYHSRVATTGAGPDSNGSTSNDLIIAVASPTSTSERGFGNGSSGNGRGSTTGPTAAAVVPHSLNPPRFYWLEVLSPHKGWALDTTISEANGTNGGTQDEDITRTTTSVPPPQGRVAGAVVARRGGATESSRWVYRVVCAGKTDKIGVVLFLFTCAHSQLYACSLQTLSMFKPCCTFLLLCCIHNVLLFFELGIHRRRPSAHGAGALVSTSLHSRTARSRRDLGAAPQ